MPEPSAEGEELDFSFIDDTVPVRQEMLELEWCARLASWDYLPAEPTPESQREVSEPSEHKTEATESEAGSPTPPRVGGRSFDGRDGVLLSHPLILTARLALPPNKIFGDHLACAVTARSTRCPPDALVQNALHVVPVNRSSCVGRCSSHPTGPTDA